MVNGQEKYSKRRRREELIIFGIKLIVYVVLIYLNVEKPALFARFPLLDRTSYVLAFFLSANLITSLAWLVIFSWYIRKNHMAIHEKDNFILGINRISSVLNTTFIIVSVMIFFGIEPVKFLTSITIVAAAIALLFKDYITNMINGLIIMFSDQLSLGDYVIIGDHKGKVMDITLVNVVLLNDDDELLLIPNSLIFTTLVVNQSKQNTRKLSIEFELDLKHHLTPEALELRLWNELKSYSTYITEGSFSLKTLEIKKDMVKFKVQLLMPRQDRDIERRIKRVIQTSIMSLSGDQ